MFRLTKTEKKELVTNCDRLDRLKHSSALPRVFTEQGVAMLSSRIPQWTNPLTMQSTNANGAKEG
jgi:hypothetical protein